MFAKMQSPHQSPPKERQKYSSFFFQKKKFKNHGVVTNIFQILAHSVTRMNILHVHFFLRSAVFQTASQNCKQQTYNMSTMYRISFFFFAIFFKNALRNRKIVVQKLALLSKWFHDYQIFQEISILIFFFLHFLVF